MISMQLNYAGNPGKTYHYHLDHLGTPREMTNEQQLHSAFSQGNLLPNASTFLPIN
jgi:hypothetical protein